MWTISDKSLIFVKKMNIYFVLSKCHFSMISSTPILPQIHFFWAVYDIHVVSICQRGWCFIGYAYFISSINGQGVNVVKPVPSLGQLRAVTGWWHEDANTLKCFPGHWFCGFPLQMVNIVQSLVWIRSWTDNLFTSGMRCLNTDIRSL